MISRNMKEKFNSKIVKVMKSTSKTKLDHWLLSITFNDKYCRSQLDFLHLSIQHKKEGHHEKKSNLKQRFTSTFGPLTKSNMDLVY